MQTLTAILTITIGVITVFIAFRQYKNDRHRIKIDLFDKRFAVYENLHYALQNMGSNRESEFNDIWSKLEEAHRLSIFLFNEKITNEISEIRALQHTFFSNEKKLKRPSISEEETQILNKRLNEADEKIINKAELLEKSLIKFMKLTM